MQERSGSFHQARGEAREGLTSRGPSAEQLLEVHAGSKAPSREEFTQMDGIGELDTQTLLNELLAGAANLTGARVVTAHGLSLVDVLLSAC